MTKSLTVILVITTFSDISISHAAFKTSPNWTPKAVEEVDCRSPSLNKKENDPVINTHVKAEFVVDKREIKSLSIIHELFSGKLRDRSKQYYQTALRKSERPDSWIWHGVDKSNLAHNTLGEFYHAPDGNWYYDEWHFGHGKLVFHSNSICHYAREPEPPDTKRPDEYAWKKLFHKF